MENRHEGETRVTLRAVHGSNLGMASSIIPNITNTLRSSRGPSKTSDDLGSKDCALRTPAEQERESKTIDPWVKYPLQDPIYTITPSRFARGLIRIFSSLN